MRDQVEKMCFELGKDPLLVQGAGGNVSWKDKEDLWIKASGTWLSDAMNKDIFIPTDIKNIQEEVTLGNFEVSPKVVNNSKLKPSIETILHALMPHKVVVHLHAVEILTFLVQGTCEQTFSQKIQKKFPYIFVEYCKPGSNLAKGVYEALQAKPDANLIFLKNHGVVLGGETAEEIMQLLRGLLDLLEVEIKKSLPEDSQIDDDYSGLVPDSNYLPAEIFKLHNLSKNISLFEFVQNKWALFPDHVVFLGAESLSGDYKYIKKELGSLNKFPPFIFCKGVGTFQHITATKAQIDQLCCFYDVVIRLDDTSQVVELSSNQIQELLDWEAEKYRLSVSKD